MHLLLTKPNKLKGVSVMEAQRYGGTNVQGQ
jgi:hypothetical protein